MLVAEVTVVAMKLVLLWDTRKQNIFKRLFDQMKRYISRDEMPGYYCTQRKTLQIVPICGNHGDHGRHGNCNYHQSHVSSAAHPPVSPGFPLV